MEAGRYAEAASKLEESYRLDPAAGTLLNMAVCHQKSGRIASAWGEYKTALSDARRMNRTDREQVALDGIAAVEPDLPFMTIVVPGPARVAGLEVVRNGIVLNSAAWATELPVDPGNVVLLERAPGYVSKTKTVTIAVRQHLTVTMEKLDLAPVVAPAGASSPGWTTKRSVGAALFLAGMVGVGVGTYFGITALDKKNTSDSLCPVMDGERRCTQAGADAMSTVRTDAWVSDIAIGVGAAAALAGVYLFITGARHDTEQGAPAPEVHVSAGLGRAFISGSF
jgi:hypothetical protein